jgi:hypothetical protein
MAYPIVREITEDLAVMEQPAATSILKSTFVPSLSEP